jgi:hypothetical protein
MSVEVVLAMPMVAVLLATVTYFRDRCLSVLSAMHAAQTDAWKRAMGNDGNRCAPPTANPLGAVGLGMVGDQAKALAQSALPSLSFAYDSGGAQAKVSVSIVHPPWPFAGTSLVKTSRADYMPCNESVGGNDGALPPAFDALWKKHAGPIQ